MKQNKSLEKLFEKFEKLAKLDKSYNNGSISYNVYLKKVKEVENETR